jgi:ribosomal protein L7/L12
MKPETIYRLRRIEQTLRTTGTPMSTYLADDISTIISDEGGSPLTAVEIENIRAGRPIETIKMVRGRKNIGLKDAKDLVEAEAEKLGLFNPNAAPGTPRWKHGF